MAQPLALDSENSTEPVAETGEEPEPEGQQAAYNPETGEINWDCPCLGGMAHGPCGEEFKEAFSCFIYSESEPKGFDCIDKFKNMQDCFRKYPEIYSEEIRNEEEPADDLSKPEDQNSSSSAVKESPGAHVHEVEKADVVSATEPSSPTESPSSPLEFGEIVEEIDVEFVPSVTDSRSFDDESK